MTFFLYFWLVVENDSNDFNWNFTVEFKLKHVPWYTIMLSLTGVAFVYLAILVGLSIYYIYVGQQLYIHPFHVAIIIFSLLNCIGFTIALDILWTYEWVVLRLSLLIFGPFIHIGLIVIFTILSWILIRQWYSLDQFRLKIITAVAYMAILIGLYTIPLFIDSPCVRPADSLPSKPRLFAHRGASTIAPENTLVAFQRAANESVYGFESDVQISLDGIPFILHDKTLRRTTNIEEVYPYRVDDDASTFTFAELRKLNAGRWFLEEDPMDVVGSLTDKAKQIYNNQTIMSLKELIDLVHLTGKRILIDIRYPVRTNRYYTAVEDRVIDVIEETGIPLKQIWWFTGFSDLDYTRRFTQTWRFYVPAKYLVKMDVFNFNARYDTLSEDEILEYIESNVTINVYLVNTYWLFSLYWCLGVQTVATDRCHILNKIEKPLWHLTPETYLMTWVSVDIISAIIIITILIVQWVRLLRAHFTPETISLHSQQSMTTLTDQYHSNSRTMKEKLLFTADQLEEDVLETTEGVSNDHIDSPTPHYMNTAANTIVISVPQ
ncbi:glycerophosphodiester phosphodiesterase domain-containing protein 5 [Octopus bimaculoides]|uniref:GP-PDE domain-containing protein n=1 Tax=Octopus bimaculoides TaxID=37653 RepID=A0A0L8GV10_OCTBM|nr:glycerophosphodiester phosphodiesterase domain-containing protein 5 [Octopus bimaculoides]|eukprot:XP_014777732.1 PREDICTED: glycerophosphodiester phosphodiesterase domain-containing protein 5-like [Octopus bimaculoides]